MISLHPQFLTKNGKHEFVIINYDEFVLLNEYLEELEDLLDLRKAKKRDKNSPRIPREDVKKHFEIST